MEQGDSSPPSHGTTVNSFLSPLTIDEQNYSIGACANQTRPRCSDKGFLSISIVDHLELLDASARMVRPDKTGHTSGQGYYSGSWSQLSKSHLAGGWSSHQKTQSPNRKRLMPESQQQSSYPAHPNLCKIHLVSFWLRETGLS